jgi:selenide, water dikinase
LGNVADQPDLALLVDPQTSGGLLLGVPASRADACMQALLHEGLTAAIIGEVEATKDGAGRIRFE